MWQLGQGLGSASVPEIARWAHADELLRNRDNARGTALMGRGFSGGYRWRSLGGRRGVSVVTRKKDAPARVTMERRYDAPRTHWVVEKRVFLMNAPPRHAHCAILGFILERPGATIRIS